MIIDQYKWSQMKYCDVPQLFLSKTTQKTNKKACRNFNFDICQYFGPILTK